MKISLNPKSIDKVAIVFLILFLISLLFTLSKQFANFTLPENDRFLMASMQMRFVWWVYALFGYVVYLGSSIWLFIEAKKTESNKWVWAINKWGQSKIIIASLPRGIGGFILL